MPDTLNTKPIPMPTPSEVLEEAASDRILSLNKPEKMAAALECLSIILPACLRAAQAGNVICQAAVHEAAVSISKLSKR